MIKPKTKKQGLLLSFLVIAIFIIGVGSLLINNYLSDTFRISNVKYQGINPDYTYVTANNFENILDESFVSDKNFLKFEYPSEWVVTEKYNNQCNPYTNNRSYCLQISDNSSNNILFKVEDNTPAYAFEYSKLSGNIYQSAYIIYNNSFGEIVRSKDYNYYYEGYIGSINIFFAKEIYKDPLVNSDTKITTFAEATNWYRLDGSTGISISYNFNNDDNNQQVAKTMDQILSTLEIDFTANPFEE